MWTIFFFFTSSWLVSTYVTFLIIAAYLRNNTIRASWRQLCESPLLPPVRCQRKQNKKYLRLSRFKRLPVTLANFCGSLPENIENYWRYLNCLPEGSTAVNYFWADLSGIIGRKRRNKTINYINKIRYTLMSIST